MLFIIIYFCRNSANCRGVWPKAKLHFGDKIEWFHKTVNAHKYYLLEALSENR